ncbi:MAG: tyrosine recombinase [Mariprofundaceae bacterium]|nr:tyrosine recombinase [Mariprofundaceae bacterium]
MDERARIEGLIDRQAMLRGWSQHTRAAYKRDLYHAENFLNQQEQTIISAQREHILSYLSHLHQEGMKESTLRRRRSALSVWFSILQEAEIRQDNPASDLPRMQQSRPLPKSITESDVNALLEAPNLSKKTGVRDRAVLELMYASGVRVSELAALTLSNMDLEMCYIRVYGKGDKERLIPFGGQAQRALLSWLSVRRDITSMAQSAYIFPNRQGRQMSRQNLWLRIKKYVQKIGLTESLSPHTLRHAFATHLLNNGADLRALQMLLGHAKINTTEIYTEVSRVRLQKIIEETHPLGEHK